MIDTKNHVLMRPTHAFDLPAVTVWVLAASGSAALRLAFALDSANAVRASRSESAIRPRSRLGPSHNVAAEHFLPDSWRIR